jgi:uncharacterized protein (TIGR03790 family)
MSCPLGVLVLLWRLVWLAGVGLGLDVAAQTGAGLPEGPAASAPRTMSGDPRPLQRRVPVVLDRLRAADIGLVINQRDPYSVAVGAHYASARGLTAQQILRVDLPVQSVLSVKEFEALQQAIQTHFGYGTQALALAWVAPYAVNCNSLGGALALGYDEALCQNSCAPSRASPYANARTARPYTDLRLRPSMHLAARSIDEAKAMIDRGVRADGTLASPGAAPVEALYVTTADAARNVRVALYPPERAEPFRGVKIRRAQGLANTAADRLLLVSVGAAELKGLPENAYVPGALADHLTSSGGDLLGQHGQSPAWLWIAAGATASHGAVSEPCNHLHKFPHPGWLLGHYVQGSTAIEAYWKSVMWPQQSLFIGEPLAAPFAPVAPRAAP